jgi:hypothetical protein
MITTVNSTKPTALASLCAVAAARRGSYDVRWGFR